jgi:hypothetical protein
LRSAVDGRQERAQSRVDEKVSGDLATIHKNILNFAAKLKFYSIMRAIFNTGLFCHETVLCRLMSVFFRIGTNGRKMFKLISNYCKSFWFTIPTTS